MLHQITVPAAPAPLAAEADDLMPHPNLTQRVGNHPLANALGEGWKVLFFEMLRRPRPDVCALLRSSRLVGYSVLPIILLRLAGEP
jgi:hypothetical protein